MQQAPEVPRPLPAYEAAPSLTGSSQRLPALVRRFLSRLTERERQAFSSWLAHTGAPTVGTVCSGTDAPIFCHEALLREAAQEFNLPHLRGAAREAHAYSCEVDPEKREFLHAMFPSVEIFTEPLELPSGEGSTLAVFSLF